MAAEQEAAKLAEHAGMDMPEFPETIISPMGVQVQKVNAPPPPDGPGPLLFIKFLGADNHVYTIKLPEEKAREIFGAMFGGVQIARPGDIPKLG